MTKNLKIYTSDFFSRNNNNILMDQNFVDCEFLIWDDLRKIRPSKPFILLLNYTEEDQFQIESIFLNSSNNFNLLCISILYIDNDHSPKKNYKSYFNEIGVDIIISGHNRLSNLRSAISEIASQTQSDISPYYLKNELYAYTSQNEPNSSDFSDIANICYGSEDKQLLKSLYYSYMILKAQTQSKAVLLTMLRMFPKDFWAVYKLAELNINLGLFHNAVFYLERITLIQKLNIHRFNLLNNMYIYSGDLNHSMDLAKSLSEISKWGIKLSKINFIKIAIFEEMFDEALKQLSETNYNLYFLEFLKLHLESELKKKALDSCITICKLILSLPNLSNKNKVTTLINQVRIYLHFGKIKAANDLLEQLISCCKNNSESKEYTHLRETLISRDKNTIKTVRQLMDYLSQNCNFIEHKLITYLPEGYL